MSRYLDLFVSEARQHLAEAEHEVSRIASGTVDAEGLNTLFRHFHSLKGMAASMGFAEIARLSHAVEDLFDEIRKVPSRALREGVADLVLESLDVVSSQVESASRGGQEFADSTALIERVKRMAGSLAEPAAEPSPPENPRSAAPEITPAQASSVYRCGLQIDPEADLPAARAALALREMESLGTILTSTPPRETLGRDPFDGSITVLLSTPLPRERIASALEGLLAVASYSLTEELLPTEGAVKKEAAVKEGEPGLPSTIRIPTAALDHFLDTLGELITWRGALAASLRSKDFESASEGHRRLTRAIERLRGEVMEIRLLPFEHLVPHLNQTVRLLSRQTGKKVALQISGTEVALDRAVLEDVLDPLNHLLRNAVDHGIEPPGDRSLAGKDPTGRIFIAVTREADRVRIRIEDDGRGMDVDAILRAAVDGKFLTAAAAAALGEDEALMLTTIPGFSTMKSPTELSGRGVGMDVVRTHVEKLGGHILLKSSRGAGVTVLLDLPLTVAVIEAFLVESGGTVFAVPASLASRTLHARREDLRQTRLGFYLDDGQTLLHAFRPAEVLGLAASGSDLRPRFPVLVFKTDSKTGAMAVDAILGRRDLVVKPLGRPLEHLREYNGAALLDDGRIALILDVPNLADLASGG